MKSTSVTVSKKTILQYIAVYIMLLINQSNFYAYYINGNDKIQLLLIVALSLMLFLKHRTKAYYGFALCVLMLFAITLVRVIYGGIGVSFWYEITLKILIVFHAVLIDEEHFLDKFINLVSLLALISLVLWMLQILGFNFAQYFFSAHDTRNILVFYDFQGTRYSSNYKCYGMLLYSYLTYYPNRNVGIFTEPGIYQSVINAALFIILFMGDYLHIDVMRKKKVFAILSLTLISTQSTSGYLGYMAILLVVLIVRQKNEMKYINWKRIAMYFVIIAAIGCSIDLLIRGEDSFINVAILSKLFNDSKELSFVAENSTGKWRVASILMSLKAMFEHPLGLGYNGWVAYSSISNMISGGGAGGWPLKLGAIIGVIPLVALLVWLIYPLRKMNSSWCIKLLVIFLYFNTSMAQTSAVYPVLIMFSVFLYNYSITDKEFILNEQEKKVVV